MNIIPRREPPGKAPATSARALLEHVQRARWLHVLAIVAALAVIAAGTHVPVEQLVAGFVAIAAIFAHGPQRRTRQSSRDGTERP